MRNTCEMWLGYIISSIMSHQVYSLWILLEGHPRSILLEDITFNLKRDANLSDFAPKLINRFNELAQINELDLEFFNYDARTKSLRSGTTLKVVEQDTSDEKPLVVRYPLTNNTSTSFFLVHISYARTVRLSHFLFLAPRPYSLGQSQIAPYSSGNFPSPHDWNLVHASY